MDKEFSYFCGCKNKPCMKKYFLLLTICVMCFQLFAQTTKKPVQQSSTPVKLSNETDSLSYSIGLLVASFYKQQGITHVNQAMVNKAISDKMNSGNTLLTEQQCNQILMTYVEKVKEEKASVAKKEGIAFLAQNKTKPGVVTTASGLQYIVLQEGTGPKPAATDKVKCNYEGKLLERKWCYSGMDGSPPVNEYRK
jgi:FKBP-type peptidyl-prolyl cis-trans isomerase FklB